MRYTSSAIEKQEFSMNLLCNNNSWELNFSLDGMTLTCAIFVKVRFFWVF